MLCDRTLAPLHSTPLSEGCAARDLLPWGPETPEMSLSHRNGVRQPTSQFRLDGGQVVDFVPWTKPPPGINGPTKNGEQTGKIHEVSTRWGVLPPSLISPVWSAKPFISWADAVASSDNNHHVHRLYHTPTPSNCSLFRRDLQRIRRIGKPRHPPHCFSQGCLTHDQEHKRRQTLRSPRQMPSV